LSTFSEQWLTASSILCQKSRYFTQGPTPGVEQYAALKADPKHQLHDYFHVINYSMWSHQVIGEATLNRSDYPTAQAVDEEIARTLAEWQRRAMAGSPK
jgi:hypothetical protein